MTTILTIVLLAALFAVFAVIPREGKDRRCFMCPIRKALGGCSDCAAPLPEDPPGAKAGQSRSRR